MMDLFSKKITIEKVRSTERFWLPLTLIVLFIIQNQLFSTWLHIFPANYIIRRTAVTLGLGTALFAPGILLKRPWRYSYLGFVSVCTGAIFIVQYLYYAYAGGFLQTSALRYANEGMSVLGTAKVLVAPGLIVFLFGPLFVLAARALTWPLPKEKALTKLERLMVIGCLVAIVLFGYGYVITREYMTAGTLKFLYQYDELFDINNLVSKVDIINYTIGDAVNAAFEPHHATPEDIAVVEAWAKTHTAPAAGATFGLAKGRNLIFIQLESVENVVLNQTYNGQELTPNLDALAKQGFYFSNYYTQVGPGNTADAEFTTLNSLYPLQDSVAFIEDAYNKYAALPQTLVDNGYHTYVLHGDVASFWNRANIYPNLGYQTVFSKSNFTIPRPIGFQGLGDQDFFAQALKQVPAFTSPFMATFITLSSHTPFQLPPDVVTLKVPSDGPLSNYQKDYLESVHYTDAAVGQFIAGLKAQGVYDKSLVVIYGDHGSYTNIESALGQSSEAVLPDLFNDQVPLIILAPGTNLVGATTTPGSHLDLYPTVAHLLGISVPASVFGQDLFATKTPVVTHQNVISGTIASIQTDKLAYESAPDGIYDHGTCLAMPDKKSLPVTNCKALYDQEENTIAVSTLVVRDNLVPLLTTITAP